MSSTDILRQQVAEVAERRIARDLAAAALKQKQEEFRASYAELFDDVARTTAELEAADSAARALAIAIHGTTGEKKPLEGVAIRMTLRVTYDDAAALAWCKASNTALIPETFDRKALEKIAKATPLPFVTITEEPSATLASDLSAYLATAHVFDGEAA